MFERTQHTTGLFFIGLATLISCALAFWMVVGAVKSFVIGLVPQAQAQETSGVRKVFYVWENAEPYKNERLRYYQELLYERNITNTDHIKNLVGQIIQENGSIVVDRHGDGNCSVGIPQRNVCQFGYSATSFVKKYPEWKDWQFQMRWMADSVKAKYEAFHGDIFKTVAAHNCPACVLEGASDNRRKIAENYWNKVRSREELLSIDN